MCSFVFCNRFRIRLLGCGSPSFSFCRNSCRCPAECRNCLMYLTVARMCSHVFVAGLDLSSIIADDYFISCG